jgi:tight adherence protein B
MFLTWLIFGGVALLSFVVILMVTRPTAVERAVENRIAKLRDSLQGTSLVDDDAGPIIKVTRLSEIACFDCLLQKLKSAHHLQTLIDQAQSSWSVPKVMGAAVTLGLAGFIGTFCAMPHASVALVPAVALTTLPFLILRFQKQQRFREFNRHLPEAIDLMSRALRAGHSLTAAIEIVGEECPDPVREEFREVYRQQNFGLPVRDALVQLAKRMPQPELGFVVTAMMLQRETGGNLVEVLDRTAGVIRDRLRIQGEIRIYTAQGRLTGWILSALPIAMFFLLTAVNRGYTRVLVEDPFGRKLVYTGLALMIVGGLVIRKIVDVKV